jgi:hypothetical protein
MTCSRWLSPFMVGSIIGSGLLTLNLRAVEAANAARIVCVSADEDSFTTAAEGYYRSLPPKQAGKPDDIRVGGSLEDCMGKADSGDQLVIVAHGNLGSFFWRTTPPGCCFSPPPVRYTGFGDGTGNQPANPHPVPDNLRHGVGIKVTFVGCNSGNDPDDEGPRKSVTQSLQDAFLQCGGCIVVGYEFKVNGQIAYAIGNFDNAAQRQAAEANLANKLEWTANPPVNRPFHATNHRTAAEAQLNAKPEFMGEGLTVTVSYLPPEEKVVLATSGVEDSLCGGVITVSSAPVPGSGGIVLVLASLLMSASGAAVVMGARRPSGPPRG